MRKSMIGTGFVAALGGLLGASAGEAATPNRYDFTREAKIRSDHTESATVVGYGKPGDGFDIDLIVAVKTPYTCDNGVTTLTWIHGTDHRTGISGYVPTCNTTYDS